MLKSRKDGRKSGNYIYEGFRAVYREDARNDFTALCKGFVHLKDYFQSKCLLRLDESVGVDTKHEFCLLVRLERRWDDDIIARWHTETTGHLKS